MLKKTKLKGKTLQLSGSDYVRQVDVFPVQSLDGGPKDGYKLVATYDITPSAFKNTRLETLSLTYQLYRFSKVTISYVSAVPTSVNGLFMAYIDTDPTDVPKVTSGQDILRLAKSHQGSIQGKIKDNWKVTMPQRKDDQFFYIGDEGDERLRTMGKLYIYQIGQATKYDGTPLQTELSAGSLSIEWSCIFMNPQLQSVDRVYDALTQKDILRIYQNVSWYRTLSNSAGGSSTITNSTHIAGTPYRQGHFILHKDLFKATGPGDYIIVQMPIKLTITNTVKALNTFALPYDNGQYDITKTSFFSALSPKEISTFMKNAYKYLEGGIKAAKTVFDVIQVASSIFLASQATGAQVTGDIMDPDDANIDHSDENLPIGQVLVHFDGNISPMVQTMIEYADITHAADNTTSFTYTVLFIAYKLNDANAKNYKKIPPSLPYVKDLN